MWKLSLLLLGQILAASSVIFIKASGIQAGFLAADRLLLAAFLLLPLFFRERSRQKTRSQLDPTIFLPSWKRSILPGVLLGLHLVTWNLGARMTIAVNASLIVNLVPVLMPFLAFFILRERPRNYEIAGTVVAAGGLAILSLGAIQLNAKTLAGDGVCLFSMILVAVYLVLGRRNTAGGLWSYVVPLYAIAGLTALLISLPFGNPLAQPLTLNDVVAVLGLTILCTIGGHTINNWAMRHFRAQVVSLLGATQFVWAGIAAWLLFGELPLANFYLACVVILTGVSIAIVPRLIHHFYPKEIV